MQGMLLDYRPECEQLYTALDVPTMQEPLLVANVILPHFGQLPEPVKEHVLARILSQWHSWRNNVALFNTLAEIPFVLTGETCTALASLASTPPASICHA